MRLETIKDILKAEVLTGNEIIDRDIKMACGCDLMSDVLSFIKSCDTMLLTGLINPQVIYTADAVDVKAICFVRGKIPEEEVIKLASDRNIVLLHTKLPMFESCGRLYEEGLKGCMEYEG